MFIAAGSLISWLIGAALLQSRARRLPVDIGLGLFLLGVTMTAFHIHAALIIAGRPQTAKWILIPLADALILALCLVGVKSRIKPGAAYRAAVAAVLIGSFGFWPWYIKELGGLLPR